MTFLLTGARYSSLHPDQAPVWQQMMAIKLNIMGRMDSAPIAIKICCIKFLQKLVQVQTPGVIADPRVRTSEGSESVELTTKQRPDQNETSLAIVPRQHPLLPLANLEAEGAGLLDRLLSVFQDPTLYVQSQDGPGKCLQLQGSYTHRCHS
jgi:symplekin